MLIRESSGDLAALERKLLNELDDQPGRKLEGNGDAGQRRHPKKESYQTSKTVKSGLPNRVPPSASVPPDGGFLF
jgi:hypothetical protein